MLTHNNEHAKIYRKLNEFQPLIFWAGVNDGIPIEKVVANSTILANRKVVLVNPTYQRIMFFSMTDMNRDPCCVGRIHLCQCQSLEFGTMSLSLCISKNVYIYILNRYMPDTHINHINMNTHRDWKFNLHTKTTVWKK